MIEIWPDVEIWASTILFSTYTPIYDGCFDDFMLRTCNVLYEAVSYYAGHNENAAKEQATELMTFSIFHIYIA